MKRILAALSFAICLALATMVILPAAFSVGGCASSLNPGTQPSVDDEVARWNASLRFWQQRVADLEIAVATTPVNSDTRDEIVKALQTAKYWLAFFQGATSQAATQPVPVGLGLKAAHR